MKATAVKSLVGQIDIFECESVCVQTDDFIVLLNVLVNFGFYVLRGRMMFVAVAVRFQNLAVLVKI